MGISLLNEFDATLNDFSLLWEKQNNSIVLTRIEETKELIKSFEPFAIKLKETERLNTPYYNLFQLLGVKHLEAVVHTPFIADLLNPDGTHSQGCYFLNKFLTNYIHNRSEITKDYSLDFLHVYKEYSFNGGQIDILIHHKHPVRNKQFAILIENKIGAGDQQNQMKRYYDYLIESMKLDNKQIKLIYLTPEGHEPSELSLNSDLKLHLYSEGVLQMFSYGNQIKKWLQNSLLLIQSEKLKQSIIQYLEILNEISYEQDQPGNI